MSQSSILSENSTIPYEIIDNQDTEFAQDLIEVENLYFPCNIDQSDECTVALPFSIESDVDSFDESDSDNDLNIPFDVSNLDEKELLAQTKFREKGCGCTAFYGKPCSDVVSYQTVIEHRDQCHELSHDELDIVIKAQLLAQIFSGFHTQAKNHKSKVREKPHQKYYFDGQQVCRELFCFAHGINRKKLQAIAASLECGRLVPRVHGNAGRQPVHSLTYQDRQRIKTFICKYGKDNALPLPGRLPNYKEFHVLLLPSDKSINDIHDEYEKTAQIMKFRSVSMKTFQRTWSELCPFISVCKPATDLCQVCQTYSAKLNKGGLISDLEMSELLNSYESHINVAKLQREYYRSQCQQSKLLYLVLQINEKVNTPAPCSVDGKLHYSWDYAQQVHYPHHAMQSGPIFFKTPIKCNVFGICSESAGKQVFYLVDEGECGGKGANTVASMVHHFFKYHGHGEKSAAIHFDNCCGQNKNNTILWYAMWRVKQGLHEDIKLSMMVPGHTKFDPDWHFALWKKGRETAMQKLWRR